MMVTVLQKDFGVKYNPERIRNPDFQNSRDLFVHGIIIGQGGTCVSMPVAYVAIGRILGYPLKLVNAPAHLFARWDDPIGVGSFRSDRFNIEASGEGLNTPSDEYYRTWPLELSRDDFDNRNYLRSLSSREETALFMANRSYCLQDNRRYTEAAQAAKWATGLAPNDVLYAALHEQHIRQQEILTERAYWYTVEQNRMRRNARNHPAFPDPIAPPPNIAVGQSHLSAHASTVVMPKQFDNVRRPLIKRS